MPDVLIENPILNSPFEEPGRHFRFTEDGITDEVVEERRVAGYFVPVPPPKKRGRQLALDTQWTQDRFKESEFINRVRARIELWRDQRWPGVTHTTERLLAYWTDPGRERRLFFCQVEAVETAIYLGEVAGKRGDTWIATSYNNAWEDTVTSGFAEKNGYVVQTQPQVVERCLLMTSDPGDLVLDPTCGSGTTAYRSSAAPSAPRSTSPPGRASTRR